MKEGTYYRIFAPLYSHEKEDIMFIWMNYIMEDVYLRRTKIEDYCRNNRTDILSALFYIYSDIQYKYLCRNNPMDYNTGYRNFYECYYSFYTLKQHFEDFLRGENVEITEIQQNSINKMIEKLEKDLYYSNSEALKDGFIDFENAGISSISKYEVNSDCNYLSIIIKEMIDERRSDPTQFRDPIVLEEAIVIFMSDLEEQMYIPYDKTEDIESSKKEEIKIPSLKSLLNLINSENHFSVEVIYAIVSNLTKDSSIVLMNSLIDETKNHINDRIINYICKETDIDQDKNNLFFQDFDEVFQEGIDNYFDLGLFDNNNLKLKKLFSKDEFRQLKFILDRLREIRDEKDGVKKKESTTLSNDSSNQNTQIQPNINNETYKEKQTHNIQKNKEEPKTEDKFDYESMVDILSPFISGGTIPIYKSIVEKKVLPKDSQSLRMKDNNKANIVRFADCFGIRISEINRIFNIKVKSNNRPKEYVNDFFRVLKGLNPDFSPPQK